MLTKTIKRPLLRWERGEGDSRGLSRAAGCLLPCVGKEGRGGEGPVNAIFHPFFYFTYSLNEIALPHNMEARNKIENIGQRRKERSKTREPSSSFAFFFPILENRGIEIESRTNFLIIGPSSSSSSSPRRNWPHQPNLTRPKLMSPSLLPIPHEASLLSLPHPSSYDSQRTCFADGPEAEAPIYPSLFYAWDVWQFSRLSHIRSKSTTLSRNIARVETDVQILPGILFPLQKLSVRQQKMQSKVLLFPLYPPPYWSIKREQGWQLPGGQQRGESVDKANAAAEGEGGNK